MPDRREGVPDNLHDCIAALNDLRNMTDTHSMADIIAVVADRRMRFLTENHGRFDCMLSTLPVPCIDVASVRSWFRVRLEFEYIELVLKVVHNGAPVAVSGEKDIAAALTVLKPQTVLLADTHRIYWQR